MYDVCVINNEKKKSIFVYFLFKDIILEQCKKQEISV